MSNPNNVNNEDENLRSTGNVWRILMTVPEFGMSDSDHL